MSRIEQASLKSVLLADQISRRTPDTLVVYSIDHGLSSCRQIDSRGLERSLTSLSSNSRAARHILAAAFSVYRYCRLSASERLDFIAEKGSPVAETGLEGTELAV